MATLNPLEQKARSSFIKGIAIATVIGIAVAGILGYFLYDMNKKESDRLAGQKAVLILKNDVVSGQVLTPDMFITRNVDKNMIPKGSIEAVGQINSSLLTDQAGNPIEKDDNGNYVLHISSEDRPETTEVDEGAHQLLLNTKNEYYYEIDSNGNRITTNAETNAKYIHISAEDNITTENEEGVYQLSNNQGYFYTANGENIPVKIEYKTITLGDTTYVAKVDLGAQTVITTGMIAPSSERVTDDLREEEYNMLVLPSTLQDDDTIDIRLRLPSGQDYVVVSKKRVKIPQLSEGPSTNSILIHVNETEILTMSAAIVDAYQITGSKLYVIKYTEPGIQSTAIPTYIPSSETINLINTDPNIVVTAKNALIQYYSANYNNFRSGVQNSINSIDSDSRKTNVETGTSTEATTSKTERQEYIQSLQ